VTEAKVLHRNININSIVLGDSGDEGKRGLLSDFSMAIFEDRESADTLVEKDLRFVCSHFSTFASD